MEALLACLRQALRKAQELNHLDTLEATGKGCEEHSLEYFAALSIHHHLD